MLVLDRQPNTSRKNPERQIYPGLLRGLTIGRPNQNWCADITNIPMAKESVCLVVVMDWFSPLVMAWQMSITLDTAFCIGAMDRHAPPEIFSTDHGVQFANTDSRDQLVVRGVRISMDGRGRYLDIIFIENLWRGLKYEDVFIKGYGSVALARGNCRLTDVVQRGATAQGAELWRTWRGFRVSDSMPRR